MTNRTTQNISRNQTGSAITEFAPALFILFIVLVFPIIDFMSLGVAYVSASTLNNLQTREAALVANEDAQAADGAVKKTIPDDWTNRGLGKFVNIEASPATNVSYKDGETDINGVTDRVVVVTTTVSARPFIYVPLIPGLPGLSAPATFTISSERIHENPGDAS